MSRDFILFFMISSNKFCISRLIPDTRYLIPITTYPSPSSSPVAPSL